MLTSILFQSLANLFEAAANRSGISLAAVKLEPCVNSYAVAKLNPSLINVQNLTFQVSMRQNSTPASCPDPKSPHATNAQILLTSDEGVTQTITVAQSSPEPIEVSEPLPYKLRDHYIFDKNILGRSPFHIDLGRRIRLYIPISNPGAKEFYTTEICLFGGRRKKYTLAGTPKGNLTMRSGVTRFELRLDDKQVIGSSTFQAKSVILDRPFSIPEGSDCPVVTISRAAFVSGIQIKCLHERHPPEVHVIVYPKHSSTI